MLIRRRVRDRLSGTLVDPRQLMLELLPCVAVGVSKDAVLSPAFGVAVRLGSDRVCRSRSWRSTRPSVWPVHWLSIGEVAPVGDSDYVRIAIPWG